MKKYIKVIFPIAIIFISIIAYIFITKNPPKAKKRPTSKISSLPVEIKQIKSEKFNIHVNSYGLARAQTQTDILSQVSGKVTYINENFRDGGYFKKGELLLKIEDIDYLANIEIARATQALAHQELLEEQAQAKQALEDWNRFNKKEKPSDLVLRVPQLKYAKANLAAAQAQVTKAQVELKRTKIIAPYDGKVVQKDVSISQVVSSSTQLGTIYAHNSIEVNLPIKNSDMVFLRDKLSKKEEIKVLFTSSLSNNTYEGKIVSTQSSIDTNTKQVYLLAKITNKADEIKIGEYLKANIHAKEIQNAILITNKSIHQSEYVYIEKDSHIFRREIEIYWNNDENTLIKTGLNPLENLVITPLGATSSGTKVKVIDKQNKVEIVTKKNKRKRKTNRSDKTK